MVIKVALGVLIGRFIYDCLFCDLTDEVRYKIYAGIDKLKEKDDPDKECHLTVYDRTNIGFKM